MDKQRSAFVQQVGDHIILLAERTNLISRTYLYHAAQGRFSQVMADVIRCIAHPTAEADIHSITRRAMQIGHTSGRDMIAGLVAGLQGWMSQSRVLDLPSE
jgi:hypothetical protein